MAAAGFKTPCMDWESDNLPDEMARFKQYSSLIFDGPFAKKSDKERSSYILLWIGQTGVNIYNSITWENEEDKFKPDKIWEAFELHLEPKVNSKLARYQLQQFRQLSSESVDGFMTRCRNQSRKCKFRDQREINERLTEQLIIGTVHAKIQEKLLQKGDELTLDNAMDIARTHEATLYHMTQLNTETQPSVHAVSNSRHSCTRCGRDHPPKPRDICPAWDSECRACGKKNHWAKVCKSKAASERKTQRNGNPQSHMKGRNKAKSAYRKKGERKTHNVSIDSEDDIDDFQSVTFETITVDTVHQRKDEIYVPISIDLKTGDKRPTYLKAKVDTGAQGNILPLRVFRNMYPQRLSSKGTPKTGTLTPSSVILTAYGGTRINQYGTCKIPCSFRGEKTEATFHVTDADGPAIIGLPTSLQLRLVTLNCHVTTEEEISTLVTDKAPAMKGKDPGMKNKPIIGKDDLMSQYPDCFTGIGKLQGEYHISTDPTIPAVVHPSRKVPISLKDDIKAELDSMEANDIITKVREGEPTAWVNSLVYRRKPNGQLRICLDPKDLNRAILRDHHVTPTLEEILPKLTGAKYFSIVDAKCGYWNIQLDEESSYLTTFNSPFGRYRFRRMPFGLKMSQDVFQLKIDQTFEGCPGVVGIADDIVISGKTEEEHDANMHSMMRRVEDTGLKLNPDKCRVKEKKIKFFGVVCGEDGVQPDPAKVSALKNMQPPTNAQELQTFLGMATYMGSFIQNLSILTAPLRELIKKDKIFDWLPEHQEAFDKIKDTISEEVTLAYFDPKKEITLQVDASLKGLGAALLQEGKPIAFASKALTDTESRYANIERELLAVVYGCERFHTYLFGYEFTVESDHKPLESIHLKHLTAAPPRLQRMLLRLQPYNLTIKYVPGKDLKIADALSRLSPEEDMPVRDLNVQIHEIYPQFSDNLLEQIRFETSKDNELSKLREVIHTGWPDHQTKLPSVLKPYWSYRDEMTVEDGIIQKGSRIVIPKTLQENILSKLHAAHQGIEKTKLRARSSVFWRNLNKDIEDITKSCTTCQEHQDRQAREPLLQTEIPPRAWHTIGTDLFDLDEDEYLLISDYFSKYPFVRKVPRGRCTSSTITNLTKQIVCEQGVPEVIRSDNGPQYTGHAFQQFAKDYGIQHITSSPHYPRSNGFIESQVKLVKRTLRKAKKSNRDVNSALLCLRTTPIDSSLPSPAELLFGRQLRDNLPRKMKRNTNSDNVADQLHRRQHLQKQHHDKSCRTLPSLNAGQRVSIRSPPAKFWQPAIIKEKLSDAPRSYTVVTPSGKELRRNRSHIRDVPQDQPRAIETTPPPDTAEPTEKTIRTPASTDVCQTRSGRIVTAPKRLDL